MTPIVSAIAQSLVATGALVLIWALIPVQRLMVRLPPGAARNRWYAMTALLLLFLFGYLSYAGVFWESHEEPLDLIVPAVFFLGACFVLLSANLSLQTAMDLIHITRLEQEIITDPLTGVFNRRYLDRRLSEEIVSARRYKLQLSVLLFDIDHFKRVNDQYGHQTGDQVLVTLGKTTLEVLRDTDVLTRYGGEEFLIMAPHTPLAGAVKLAERVRQHIEAHDFGLPGTPGAAPGAKVTVSMGVAVFGDGIDDTERLVRVADENLYRAKLEGRNRVVAGILVAQPSPV